MKSQGKCPRGYVDIRVSWEELEAIVDNLHHRFGAISVPPIGTDGTRNEEALLRGEKLYYRLLKVLDSSGKFENAGGPTHWEDQREWDS